MCCVLYWKVQDDLPSYSEATTEVVSSKVLAVPRVQVTKSHFYCTNKCKLISELYFPVLALQPGDDDIESLLANNRRWVERMNREDPTFFPRLGRGQAPKYLYIGCSDSRVPANQILGLEPGQVFVHRNVGNLMPVSSVIYTQI
jgi:hypothetical protein